MVNERPTPVIASLDQLATRRQLSSEAAALVAAYGPNPYSDFLVKHGCRPGRKVAATIGRLIGVRVKASDGSMQPPRGKADKLARAALYRKWDHIARLRSALAQLAQNEDAPESIIHSIVSEDGSEISANLDKSLSWLLRFADHWRSHGTNQTPEVADGYPRRLRRFASLRAANDS